MDIFMMSIALSNPGPPPSVAWLLLGTLWLFFSFIGIFAGVGIGLICVRQMPAISPNIGFITGMVSGVAIAFVATWSSLFRDLSILPEMVGTGLASATLTAVVCYMIERNDRG